MTMLQGTNFPLVLCTHCMTRGFVLRVCLCMPAAEGEHIPLCSAPPPADEAGISGPLCIYQSRGALVCSLKFSQPAAQRCFVGAVIPEQDACAVQDRLQA
jgi:hypothetical protein